MSKINPSSSIVFFFLLSISLPNWAQISSGGQPYSFQETAKVSSKIPTVVMPAFSLKNLQVEDAQNDAKGAAYRFGKAFTVDLNLENSGVWENLANGDRLWRLKIQSKDAKSIHLTYGNFYLPPRAKLHLYTPKKDLLLGAFTQKNNKSYRKFATGIVKGETTILEYYEPMEVKGKGLLQISEVVHNYRGFYDDLEKDFGDSGSCNNNINCPEWAEWKDQQQATVLIIRGNTRECTGAMINTVRADCTPYLLTANHCNVGNPETTLFIFNYESPDCSGLDGQLNQSVVGARIVASKLESDFELLELSVPPPPDYNVFYAGWNNNDEAATSTVCIHHPRGDVKKISLNNNEVTSSTWSNGPTDTHWSISEWEDGTTEPASSGAPIFNQNGRLVGQLHGGEASCEDTDSFDAYGKLSNSWDAGTNTSSRLKDWLDPENSGTSIIDGRYCTEETLVSDVALLRIVAPAFDLCKLDEITSIISIQNKGSEELNELTVFYKIDDGDLQTFSWSGKLATFEREDIDLGQLPDDLALGNHTLEVRLDRPNGNQDMRRSDNELIYSFTIQDGALFKVNVVTDDFGNETTFQIQDESGNQLYRQGPFSNKTSFDFDFCLLDGCYNFIMFDSEDDGMCCDFGTGSYGLFLNNTIIKNGGSFSSSDTTRFCTDGTVGNNTVLSSIVANNTKICAGESVSFEANLFGEAIAYEWHFVGAKPSSSTAINPVTAYNQAGRYAVSLILTHANGTDSLTFSNYIEVFEPLQANLLTTPSTTATSQNGSVHVTTLGGQEPYFYIWSNGGASASSQSNLSAGDYVLTITDVNGCELVLPFVIKADTVDGVATTIPQNEILLYPNPNKGQFWIYIDKDVPNAPTSLQLFGLNGQALFSTSLQKGSNSINLKESIGLGNSFLKTGVYMAVLTVGEAKEVRKVVVGM